MSKKNAAEPKKKEKADSKVVRERTENLSVALTDAELIKRGEALALKVQEGNELEAHAKAVKDELKSKDAAIQAEVQRLTGIVRRKAEPRDVVVIDTAFFKEGVVRSVRQDTGEVIKERKVEEYERQVDMLLSPAKMKAAADDEDKKNTEVVGELIAEAGLEHVAEGIIVGQVTRLRGHGGKLSAEERKQILAEIEAAQKKANDEPESTGDDQGDDDQAQAEGNKEPGGE